MDLAVRHNGQVFIGGPGTGLATHCDGFEPLLYHNPSATFTSRGCPNRCGFCAVPILEGDFRELKTFRPAPNIMDNNILESSRAHFERVIDAIKHFPFVDFSQGLEARKLTPWHIDQLCRLKSVKLRFALDHPNHEAAVHDAIALCRQNGFRDFGVYCLIGFRDTPDDALYRLEKIRSWGIRPNPMRFTPLNATQKNTYVGCNWTEKELRKIMKYYARLRYFEHIPFDEFDYLKHDVNQTELF